MLGDKRYICCGTRGISVVGQEVYLLWDKRYICCGTRGISVVGQEVYLLGDRGISIGGQSIYWVVAAHTCHPSPPSLPLGPHLSPYIALSMHVMCYQCRKWAGLSSTGSGLLCKHPCSLLLHPGTAGDWGRTGEGEGLLPRGSHDLHHL